MRAEKICRDLIRVAPKALVRGIKCWWLAAHSLARVPLIVFIQGSYELIET